MVSSQISVKESDPYARDYDTALHDQQERAIIEAQIREQNALDFANLYLAIIEDVLADHNGVCVVPIYTNDINIDLTTTFELNNPETLVNLYNQLIVELHISNSKFWAGTTESEIKIGRQVIKNRRIVFYFEGNEVFKTRDFDEDKDRIIVTKRTMVEKIRRALQELLKSQRVAEETADTSKIDKQIFEIMERHQLV